MGGSGYAKLMNPLNEAGPWESAFPAHHLDGSSEAFGFYLSELVLSSGSRVPLNRSGVTVIVGGNNVGKSTLLRELHQALEIWPGNGQPRPSSFVLQDVPYEWEGTTADMVAWIGAHNYWSSDPNNMGFVAGTTGSITPPSHLSHLRDRPNREGIGGLSKFVVHFATAMGRFAGIHPVGRRASMNDAPNNPLHIIEQTPGMLQEFQRAAEDIFGVDLTLDRLGGSLFFRVGVPTVPPPTIDNVAGEYLDQLLALPALETQGEGMQSALGLLLPVITATYPLILVDEPEAFLHPPQARKLGAILASLAHERGVQLVVATHDRHFLTGILDAEGVDVSVIRLERTGNNTEGKHLDSGSLKQAWGKASVRYSNLLDGLFHKLVVIAENERDCRFLAAALDALDQKVDFGIRPQDVLFLPSAGKGNIPSLAEVLLASGVPVVAAPDLDVLNNEQNIERLYSALGGEWAALKPTYTTAVAEFQVPRAQKSNGQVLSILQSVLSAEPNATYTSQTKSEVSLLLGVSSEWKRLKENGMIAFRAERAKANELMGELAKHRVVPVQVGELEGFAPEVRARKGDAWLEEALETKAHQNREVEEHLCRILAAAGYTDPQTR